MRRVDQVLPTFARWDAIGSHAVNVRRALRRAGFASDIYAEEASDDHEVRRLVALDGSSDTPDRAVIYHLSIGSPSVDVVRTRRGPKLVNYHNITPPSYFRFWDPLTAPRLALARRQLVELAPVTDIAVAVSQFNERELQEAGYRETAVAPILVDLSALDEADDPATATRLRRTKDSGGVDWLFVGRLAPNKAQHDLIKAFAVFRRVYDSRARLHLVGGSAARSYSDALHRFVNELGLTDAVDLTGSVSSAALAAHYRHADVFVCVSEHEGFCVPLLEAMHHRVPIVAYQAAAVPETLAGAGVVVADKAPATVAAAVARVVGDAALAGALADAGAARARDFALDRTEARFIEVLEGALS